MWSSSWLLKKEIKVNCRSLKTGTVSDPHRSGTPPKALKRPEHRSDEAGEEAWRAGHRRPGAGEGKRAG